jgi:hypothetical protein
MSFAGLPMPFIGTKEEYEKYMARQEIKKRTANLISVCQWRYWLKTEVVVDWPQGWTPQDHLGNSAESADPNVWYRAWLETNVGPQGWTWDWRIKNDMSYYSDSVDQLIIKFRKAADATAFALKWA